MSKTKVHLNVILKIAQSGHAGITAGLTICIIHVFKKGITNWASNWSNIFPRCVCDFQSLQLIEVSTKLILQKEKVFKFKMLGKTFPNL